MLRSASKLVPPGRTAIRAPDTRSAAAPVVQGRGSTVGNSGGIPFAFRLADAPVLPRPGHGPVQMKTPPGTPAPEGAKEEEKKEATPATSGGPPPAGKLPEGEAKKAPDMQAPAETPPGPKKTEAPAALPPVVTRLISAQQGSHLGINLRDAAVDGAFFGEIGNPPALIKPDDHGLKFVWTLASGVWLSLHLHDLGSAGVFPTLGGAWISGVNGSTALEQFKREIKTRIIGILLPHLATWIDAKKPPWAAKWQSPSPGHDDGGDPLTKGPPPPPPPPAATAGK